MQSQSNYKMEPHRIEWSKVIHRNWCVKCGLVILNNKLTRWCVDKGCNNEDHHDWKRVRKEYVVK